MHLVSEAKWIVQRGSSMNSTVGEQYIATPQMLF